MYERLTLTSLNIFNLHYLHLNGLVLAVLYFYVLYQSSHLQCQSIVKTYSYYKIFLLIS
jgi:hypothetical protein